MDLSSAFSTIVADLPAVFSMTVVGLVRSEERRVGKEC